MGEIVKSFSVPHVSIVPISLLKTPQKPKNYEKNNPHYRLIRSSIGENGFLSFIVIDPNGKVLIGRESLWAAIDLGYDCVPVNYRESI